MSQLNCLEMQSNISIDNILVNIEFEKRNQKKDQHNRRTVDQINNAMKNNQFEVFIYVGGGFSIK